MPDYGLTIAEAAEVMLLQAPAEKVCSAAAVRELQARRPALQTLAEDADAALAAAEHLLDAPRAALVPLQHDLAEVRRQLAGHTGVTDGDPLAVRLAAKRDIAVLRAEETELTERIHLIENMLLPVIAKVNTARMDAERARVRVEALDAAIAHPLTSSAGLETGGGTEYLRLTGRWCAHLDPSERNTIMGRASREFLMRVLRDSGVGAEIEQQVLDHQSTVQGRKDGLLQGSNGMYFASSKGWDGKGGQPDKLQYTAESAGWNTVSSGISSAAGRPRRVCTSPRCSP